jgi:hypothetical protein
MAKHTYVVKVPRPDPKSYNPDRPITGLVQNQLLHLSVAERHLPEHHRSGIDPYSVNTEAKAAKYVAHLTAKLHAVGKKKSRSKKQSAKVHQGGEVKRKNPTQRKVKSR